jgi:hypothetical protein
MYEGVTAYDGSDLLNGGELRKVLVKGGPLFTSTDSPATTPFSGCSCRGSQNSCKTCMVVAFKLALDATVTEQTTGILSFLFSPCMHACLLVVDDCSWCFAKEKEARIKQAGS